ncbi:MAG: DUF4034 domain-containing protein [Cyanobacteria bacterium P01_A01_bin.83]
MVNIEQQNFAAIPYEKQAKIIAKLLQENKFVRIEQIINDALQNKLLTRGGSLYGAAILDRLFKQANPDIIVFLNRWIEQRPNSSLAYTARSYFYYFYAWSFRGNKYINLTQENAIQKYLQQLDLSNKDIKQALRLDSENPLALLLLMRIGRNTQISEEIFNQYFEKVTAIVPFFFQAYQEKRAYLAPEWNGDAMTMLSFAKQSTMAAPRGTAIPLLLPQAHNRLCNYRRSCQKSKYYSEPLVWQDIEKSYLRLIEDFPRSGVYPYWFAKKAKQAGKTKIARQYYELAIRREPHNKLIRSKAKLYR